ncbi:thermonuclease family protein [Thiogranum longum]
MRLPHRWFKKAPLFGAFFLLLVRLDAATADTCSPPHSSEPVRVRYVHDGDTLTLTDDRTVRLVGINTPETADKDQTDQPLAIEARNRLRQLLFQQGNRAQLVYGPDRQDRHSRTLAHLWSPDGQNLTATLLREGFGWAIAIPPNIRWLDCYLESEKTAREAARGVWVHPELAAKASNELTLRDTGFHLVRGRIVRVNRGGGALWINLEGRFAARIPEQDIKWFKDLPDNSWLGRDIEVRGWLYQMKGELRVNVHHPSAIQMRAVR